ncbi:uncharacterized protein K452DRAFT_243696 [Aplosporella prunicola CBS 121167]|uniref:Protein kinase domain-containing protein n=1 Tax=Aplosporella prunicola CBS 121167 TaxID=1176127 RepID=A0A6A6BN41_9PEZI|nr:uncharacterized protein K452DRAFT_243696 [Aplosporella prunicola CBS 121167]KAF2145559.1 hypothetical protein K452DRAFT_243696 [Aplosporella prunicola CBS 121167]
MYDLYRVKTSESSSADDLSRSLSNTVISNIHPDHKDGIITALLMRDSLNLALEHFNHKEAGTGAPTRSKDDPEVQELAKKHYHSMAASMLTAGITSSNIHHDEKLRGQYAQAYDSVAKDHIATLAEGGPSLLKSSSALTLASQGFRAQRQHDAPRPQIGYVQPQNFKHLPSLVQPLVDENHPIFRNALSTHGIILVEAIGKGGYGTVFKAVHPLDGGFYAIKQIPLSPARMEGIRKRGKAELDALFVEVRTMQRFDHPNIVRYHNAWLESLSLDSLAKVKKQQKLLEGVTATSSEAESDSSGPSQSSNGIEPSLGLSNNFSDLSDNVVFGDDTSVSVSVSTSIPKRLRKRSESHGTLSSSLSKKSTVHSIGSDIEDEDIETIPRNLSEIEKQRDLSLSHNILFEESQSDNRSATSMEEEPPADNLHLVLHIQMALYDLTLADYISSAPGARVDGTLSLRHCFHTKMSLEILLAVLDGVEYLHAQGVVHRDLKPANIFLSPVVDKYRHKDRVALEKCHGCIKAGSKRIHQLGVKIGDFGLVTAIARPDTESQHGRVRAVGTEFYRPPSAPAQPNEKLDVYALGVITFELLWKFDTRMERAHVLQDLKRGKLPVTFEERMDFAGDRLAKCIKGMVHWDEAQRLTLTEAQHEFEAILRAAEP